ncbi:MULTISPECIES: ABC transporter permease [Acidovorax]|uniref:Peptide/nickel transport system permease protein n=1 Tax=Acidovorax soli TaxID=592050 RepID=A0A1H3XRF6_9BURK|nr:MULTISPECIES: ABC transporter permease [Acidovorax]SEA01913.1 peptide/nickel transport system permease protein [Acidovorax soli]
MTTPAAPASPVRGTSPIRAKFRRFASDRIAMTGVVMFAVVALLCIFARQICAFDPNGIDLTAARQAPNAVHWLGTDQTGRDMLARTLAAGQISLLVGVCSVLIALVIGTVLGALAGYFGGWIDNLVMRLVDVVMTFPTVIVLLTLSAVIGSGTANTIWIIGALSWPLACRLVRARVLSIREADFVAAARVMGAGDLYIIARHCIPNTTDVLVVFASLGFVAAIMAEAGLSFLGLGVQLPDASWGSLLSIAREASVLKQYPWIWLPAGLFIVFTALAANFIGDGLRHAFDPKSNKESVE